MPMLEAVVVWGCRDIVHTEHPGAPVEFTGMGTARIRDGQIVELWVNGDLLGLLQQLGATVMPPADAASG